MFNVCSKSIVKNALEVGRLLDWIITVIEVSSTILTTPLQFKRLIYKTHQLLKLMSNYKKKKSQLGIGLAF